MLHSEEIIWHCGDDVKLYPNVNISTIFFLYFFHCGFVVNLLTIKTSQNYFYKVVPNILHSKAVWPKKFASPM